MSLALKLEVDPTEPRQLTVEVVAANYRGTIPLLCAVAAEIDAVTTAMVSVDVTGGVALVVFRYASDAADALPAIEEIVRQAGDAAPCSPPARQITRYFTPIARD